MKTVWCVVPVHNRLNHTESCVQQLSEQTFQKLEIVIVDDGSTDGTFEYLRKLNLPNLTVLRGDGTLWWGGCMREGMTYVSRFADEGDYLLMLNDDVTITADFVEAMVLASEYAGGAIVGATQCDQDTGEVMGCGSGIDYFHMQIFPLRCDQRMDVGALPGRGALFPWKVCLSIGHIRTSLFRHYGADTEYSARARDYGWPIIVSRNARVFSSRKSSDEMVRRRGRIVDMLSFRSKNHLMRRLLFFSIRGPIYLRFWAVPRYISVAGWRWLKGIRRARGRIRDVG